MEIGKVYKGGERRFSHRRTIKDRRDMIRFELDKQDRRANKDRRSSNNIWKYRN